MSDVIIRWNEKQPDGVWIAQSKSFSSYDTAVEFKSSLLDRDTVVIEPRPFPPYTEKELMYFGGLASLDDVLEERLSSRR